MTLILEKNEPKLRSPSEIKSDGATYTPRSLADFVASNIIGAAPNITSNKSLRILDPAIGDGELLLSILGKIPKLSTTEVEVFGFETNQTALETAKKRISKSYPNVKINFTLRSFLEYVLENYGSGGKERSLFEDNSAERFDLIIANPPYVRTQIMGAKSAQIIARNFDLNGRVDLYYAFIFAISQALKPTGTAGIIVSNRFMSTKSGASVREGILDRFDVHHIWDLGDTKIFDAAVLPAVLLVKSKSKSTLLPKFTSIYEKPKTKSTFNYSSPIEALNGNGIVSVSDGRSFEVRNGILNTSGDLDGVWRLSEETSEAWLQTVASHTSSTFKDIGKIRVGVKTCADKIFIRNDWDDLPDKLNRPELLKPLTTHHNANRYRARTNDVKQEILYPHESINGKRHTIDIEEHPNTNTYLNQHKPKLEGRKYVIEAGRHWYEIWVPQDPAVWNTPKLVFRDISEKPTFWIDQSGSIINGDCYWLAPKNTSDTEPLWLAVAVANSTFIEKFYDLCFPNKLYAGRRRFITQYVEKFPMPNPTSKIGKLIISKSKEVYKTIPNGDTKSLENEIDCLVWQSFGLVFEEI